jgi:hypothetical protein
MIIKFTKLLNLKTLRNIAKINNIKHISNYSKYNLLSYLSIYKSVIPIQRYFRLKNMKEDFCPISMEKLKYPFIVIKSNNTFNYYDFNTIIEYFKSSRDFRDPLTRKIIPDSKIIKINKMIEYYYGNRSIKHLWTNSMIKTIEFNCIQSRIYDLIDDIMSTKELSNDFIIDIANPQIILYFQSLLNNDFFTASVLIKNFFSIIFEHECKRKDLILNCINQILTINQISII